MCFTEIYVLLFLNKILLLISYHGQHLFISHRLLKSRSEKLIPHAKIHHQSPKKANDRRKFLPEEKERGRRPLINRVGVPPCTAFTSIVFYHVLQHWFNYFYFQISFIRSAFRTPPLHLALQLERNLTFQGGDVCDTVSTRSYSNYTEIGQYS